MKPTQTAAMTAANQLHNSTTSIDSRNGGDTMTMATRTVPTTMACDLYANATSHGSNMAVAAAAAEAAAEAAAAAATPPLPLPLPMEDCAECVGFGPAQCPGMKDSAPVNSAPVGEPVDSAPVGAPVAEAGTTGAAAAAAAPVSTRASVRARTAGAIGARAGAGAAISHATVARLVEKAVNAEAPLPPTGLEDKNENEEETDTDTETGSVLEVLSRLDEAGFFSGRRA